MFLLGNTDEGFLHTIAGDTHLAGGIALVAFPARDLVQNGLDLIGFCPLQILAALIPNLHDADTLTAYSTRSWNTAKFATAEEAPTLIQIHLVPAIRQKGVEVV